MTERCNGDALARQRTIIVILRLVTGPGGELSHGEIVDPVGWVGARFLTWETLLPTLRAWLETAEHE